MNCEEVRRWLARDLDGEAEPSADAAAHLERCAACREEAGRLKSISAATRAALPRATVPLDFEERVMAHLLPPADEALDERARPRLRRWWPLLVPVLVLAVWPLLGGRDAPDAPHDTPLAPLAKTSLGGADITALGPALVRDGALHGGAALLEAGDESAAIETPLGTIRLAPHSRAVARFGTTQEETMNARLAPTVLTLTLLAGNCAVTNAEGEAAAEPQKPVRVVKGRPPVLDAEALRTEMDRIRAIVATANARLAAVAEQLAALEGDVVREDEDMERELRRREEEIVRLRKEIEQYRRRRRDEIEAVDRARLGAADMEAALLEKLRARAAELEARIENLVRRIRAICADGGLPTRALVEELAESITALKQTGKEAAAKGEQDTAERIRFGAQHGVEVLRLALALRELDEGHHYEVVAGDTLDRIAASFDVHPREIVAHNPGLEPERLRPGQTIRIPGNRAEFDLLRTQLAKGIVDHDEADPKPERKTTGRVLETRGNIVAISVGSEDGVRVGDVFTIAREGTFVGLARVTKVYTGQSAAELDRKHAGPGAPVAVGDVAHPHRK